MIQGLVSVIIPVHDRSGMLVEAVESVLRQSYANWEVVIVDDGSTDDTPSTIRELEEAHRGRIRSVRQQNAGPGSAREAGRRASRGEYLQFLDSDDLLLPGKLEIQVASLSGRTRNSVSYGPTRSQTADGRIQEPARRTGEALGAMFPSLLLGRLWMTVTPLYRASTCEEAGGWSDLRLEEDWEFEARVAALPAQLVHVGEAVAVYRQHGGRRAGSGESLAPDRIRWQAAAHARILESALHAGVRAGAPEMASFARALFLLSRKAGAAGLANESRDLFRLARRASTPERARGLDFLLYGAAAAALGWTTVGRLAIGRELKAGR